MVRILTLAVRDLGSSPGRSAKREVTKVLSTGGQEPSVSGFDSHLLDKKQRGVAVGSAGALGASGRQFESGYPDKRVLKY